MTSSRELYWQQIQLEPDWQRPLIVGNTRRSYKEQPEIFTPERIARHIREDQEMQERWDLENGFNNGLK